MLLSPRIFDNGIGKNISNAGSLMGEPGTKIVLTFLAKVANVYTHNGVASFYFSTAGDDQIDAADDPKDLLRYAEASRITTMKPSLEKWGIMQYAVNYCQQGLLCRTTTGGSEIAVPKVRLLSPEQKTSRGDQDTNPAYGKARQFSQEMGWCENARIAQSMLFLFLRNMNQYVQYNHELFTPREWGGLGLPGLLTEPLEPYIPEWKRNAITQREQGCYLTSKLLSRWSNSRNFERGILLEENSAQEAYTDLVRNFLPIVKDVKEVVTDLPKNARFRECLREAENLGYMTVDSLVNKILAAQRYQEFWTVESRPDRGFKSLTWSQRSRRMSEGYAKIQTVFTPQPLPTDGPRWAPSELVYTKGDFPFSTDRENAQTAETLPLLGPALNSPRVFLHYSNIRLLRNVDRSQRH
jgi:hypothetical protein